MGGTTLTSGSLPGTSPSTVAPEASSTAAHDLKDSDLPNRSKYKRLTWACVGLGALVVGGGAERLIMSGTQSSHEAVWGNLSHPKFIPTNATSTINFKPLSTRASEIIGETKQKDTVLKNAAVTLAKLQQTLTQNGPSPQLLTQLNEMTRDLPYDAKPTIPEGVCLIGDHARSDEFLTRNGPAEELARRVFERMTGQALPDLVSVKVDPDLHSADGLAHEASSSIRIQDLPYARQLRVLLHEFGHLASQVGENARFNSVLGISALDEAIRAREEAAAELFMLASLTHLDDTKLVQDIGELNAENILDYYRGTDTGFFNRGCVIANAALRLTSGDPAKAYLLVTSPDFDAKHAELYAAIEAERASVAAWDEMERLASETVTEFGRQRKIWNQLRESLQPNPQAPSLTQGE